MWFSRSYDDAKRGTTAEITRATCAARQGVRRLPPEAGDSAQQLVRPREIQMSRGELERDTDRVTSRFKLCQRYWKASRDSGERSDRTEQGQEAIGRNTRPEAPIT